MGYALWIHPNEVYLGYKKGLSQHGVIDLKLSKEKLLDLEFDELEIHIQKNNNTHMSFFAWVLFFFWCLMNQLVLLFPIILILLAIYFI